MEWSCRVRVLFLFFVATQLFWSTSPVNAGGTCRPRSDSLAVFCSQFPGMADGDMVFVDDRDVPIPNSNITIPNNIFVQETYLESALKVTMLRIAGGMLRGKCADAYLNSLCSTFLRPCIRQGNEYIPHPVMPCRQICFDYMEECKGQVTTFGGAMWLPEGEMIREGGLLDCFERDINADNASFWEEPTYLYVDAESGWQTSLTCLSVNIAESKALCHGRLVPSGRSCAVPCPAPGVTEKQYDDIHIMQSVLAVLSWFGSLLLIVSFFLDPRLRTFPANLVLMVAICAHIAAWAMLIALFAGYQETWCGDDVFTPTVTTQVEEATVQFDMESLSAKSGLCTFQGVLLHFGFIGMSIWCFFVTLNLFLEVTFPTRLTAHHKRKREVVYHCVGWIVPTLFIIILAGADKYAFPPGSSMCFVSHEDDGIWRILFWFLPVSLCIFLSLCLFLFSSVILMRSALQSTQSRTRVLRTYLRLMVFILLFLVCCICQFAYELNYTLHEEDITSGYEDYLNCVYVYNTAQPISTNSCDLSDTVANYELMVLKGIGYTFVGLLLFLLFVDRCFFVLWATIEGGRKGGNSKSGGGGGGMKDEGDGCFGRILFRRTTSTASSSATSSTKTIGY
ncbi:Frizzled/Smoothened membrane region [Balamuthia mandrillaris]